MTDENSGSTYWASRLQLVGAAVLFSTGGAAVKATDLGGWEVAGLRAGIAALFLLCASAKARRGYGVGTLAVGLALGAALLLFVLANKLTTAANTIFLVSTSPFYIAVLSPWLLGERMRTRDLGLMALIGAGMALFFLGNETAQSTAPSPFEGNLLAAGSGLAWALTVIGLRALSRGQEGRSAGSIPAVVLGNGLVFALCAPRLVSLAAVNASDLLVVTYLGAVQIGVAYLLLTAAMRQVPAIEASLVLMVEPVLSPVWAWWFHGESVSRLALVGGMLILAATLLPALYGAARRSTAGLP